eukprot:scaffold3680_cov133-Isochrysis_galbana.AAC.8
MASAIMVRVAHAKRGRAPRSHKPAATLAQPRGGISSRAGAAGRVVGVDNRDELNEHNHGQRAPEWHRVGSHEGDDGVDEVQVAVGGMRAELVLAVLQVEVRQEPVQGVADGLRRLNVRVAPREIFAELGAGGVLQNGGHIQLPLGQHGARGVVGRDEVETRVAAAELVGAAGHAFNLGERNLANAAVEAALPDAVDIAEGLVGYVRQRPQIEDHQRGCGQLDDQRQDLE